MAKSKNFFGLRKGSTKDFTFATLYGQQITKSRVTDIANPQTTSQMEQRLRLPLVSNAATQLKELVNHSFEGESGARANLRMFKQLNLYKNALQVYQYVPKGAGDCGIADFIIAKGSLPNPGPEILSTSANEGGFSYRADPLPGAAPSALFSEGTYASVDDMIAKAVAAGIPDGLQITFIFEIRNGLEYSWMIGDVKHSAYRHDFAVARFIFTKDSNPQWTLVSTEKGSKIKYAATNADYTFTFTLGDTGIVSVDEGLLTNAYAVGVIYSLKEGDSYKRSTSRMVPTYIDTSASIASVLATYQKNAISGLYLNQGDDDLGIIEGVLK